VFNQYFSALFKDTEIDFTYPKKIKNSTIEGEYLAEFPNINYKKVCIFMGANASGKTSLIAFLAII
jgi:AAA15 family ATPase/GTPase